jgi:LCP family protein required for cell wall assembly
VDFNTKQVRILSIPRDGWVEELNSRGDVVHDKLAHAYAHGQELYKGEPDGGIRNAADAVHRLIGIQPDYYVVIQFDGLAKLVDALGGLDVDVEKRMKYTDRAGGLFIDFQPGPQHMTGAQVVEYARFRHDAVGDIGRMARQQKVIKLIMEKVKQPQNLTRLTELSSILQEAILTNFTPDQLFAFLQHIKDFEGSGIQSQTLMSYGNQEKGHEHDAVGAPRGMSVQIIYPKDVEASKAFLEDLSIPPPPVPEGVDGQAAEGKGQAAAGSKDHAQAGDGTSASSADDAAGSPDDSGSADDAPDKTF